MTRERLFTSFLNGMTVFIALLVIVLLIKQFVTRPVDPSLPHGPTIGSRIDLPVVNGLYGGSTLVFAMQIGCHWCEASAGFYRDLIRSNSTGAVHFVAVLPQPI